MSFLLSIFGCYISGTSCTTQLSIDNTYSPILLFMSQLELINSQPSAIDFGSQKGIKRAGSVQNQTENYQSENKQPHLERGGLLKSMVYGGLDGSTATIIILLSGMASQTPNSSLFNIALAALFANAISMGLGDYLSCKAEISYIRNIKAKETTKIEQNLEQIKDDLIQIYTRIDPDTNTALYSQQDARTVTQLLSPHKHAMASILMLYKHKLAPVDPDLAPKCGAATFISFLICGSVPLLFFKSFLALFGGHVSIIIALGSLQLFSLGWAKATLIGLNKWKAGCEMLIFGVLASVIGYGVGFLSR